MTMFKSVLYGDDPNLIDLLLKAGGKRAVFEQIAEYRLGMLASSEEPADFALLRYFITHGIKADQLIINTTEDRHPEFGHNFTDKTALHYAAAECLVENARFLLDAGASVNSRDSEGATPLMAALARSHIAQAPYPERLAISRLLLARGANVGLQDKYGRTALFLLLETQQQDPWTAIPSREFLTLVASLSKGVDLLKAVRAVDGKTPAMEGMTPLELAVLLDDPELVVTLTGFAEPAVKVKTLNTAASYAASRGKTEMVKALIAKGADLRFHDAAGASLLMLAAQAGEAPLVQFLLAKGLTASEADTTGATALHYAARGGSLASLKLLFGKAELERKTSSGRTPLMEAASAGTPDLIGFLLAQGAAVNVTDKQGATPLLLAAGSKSEHRHRVEVMEQLLQKGALTTVSDANKRTLLHYATLSLDNADGPCGFDSSAASWAVGQKLEINARDRYGRTALMNAVYSLDPKLIELLLAKGADPAIKSAEGKTAADELKIITCSFLGAGDQPESVSVLRSSRSAEAEAILTMLKKATK